MLSEGNMKKLFLAFAVAAMLASAVDAGTQNYPAPKEGDSVGAVIPV
jgi:hypothetical protein